MATVVMTTRGARLRPNLSNRTENNQRAAAERQSLRWEKWLLVIFQFLPACIISNQWYNQSIFSVSAVYSYWWTLQLSPSQFTPLARRGENTTSIRAATVQTLVKLPPPTVLHRGFKWSNWFHTAHKSWAACLERSFSGDYCIVGFRSNFMLDSNLRFTRGQVLPALSPWKSRRDPWARWCVWTPR